MFYVSIQYLKEEILQQCMSLCLVSFSRLEVGSYRSVPSDYTVQMEDEEEREALIINPSEHVVVRKVGE